MKIFFSGIGGAGLSPLAQLCLDCGWEVVGSDREESLNTSELAKRGVLYSLDQSGKFLEEEHTKGKIDLYVHSSAVKPDNPEYIKAVELGIPLSKRSGLLNTILSEKKLKLLAVAGTHGKTTTTAMCVWLFKQLDIPISYSIGSNISFGSAAQYQAGSEWFVYECDEFDRNFLDFYPEVSIITSLDYDHPDTYSTQELYYKAFQQFVLQTGEYLYAWKSDMAHLSLNNTKIDAEQITNDPEEMRTKTLLPSMQLTGKHNRRNALLAIQAVGSIVQKNPEKLSSLINKFPGTQRRFEKITEGVYTDYAHHPSEIAATLQLAKELSDKVVVVYQPHQNIRQLAVGDLYKECFAGASAVHWLPTYLSREPTGIPVLSPQELGHQVKDANVIYSNLDDVLHKDLVAKKQEGYIIVFMGAGSIDAWAREHFGSMTVK